MKNLFGAEIAAKEMGGLSLIEALDYIALLAEVKPEKFELAAVRWHGRLELEAAVLTLEESQLMLAALAGFRAAPTEALPLLKRLLRQARPTLARRMS
jgi:hypothetical protein